MSILDFWKKAEGYEVPTVFKHDLLRPYFEKANLTGPIFDIGCGGGYFSEILSSRGYEVIGIDKNNKSFPKSKVKYARMDGVSLGLKDSIFGSVLLINVLSCVDYEKDRIKILDEAKRVKNDNGLIYVVNFSVDMPYNSDLLAVEKLFNQKLRLKIKKINGDYITFEDYYISKKDMQEYASKTGLKIVEIQDFKHPKLEIIIYTLYILK